jgi:hypothetical protein
MRAATHDAGDGRQFRIGMAPGDGACGRRRCRWISPASYLQPDVIGSATCGGQR